ncbi:putative DNA-binding transcriptional regulator YafY [Tamaricihabitans halophyticus]|uniref:Putative DNA-binding transcriptional regulator YafY n=1 Tax=Tamaricihabitans halophyticus TaxID=1262583 RepID=A0A4R2R175_9PSEU|nr:YafY family protein [Tamaricihabitans halophyticus]TCP56422.1 putative DNA-binding transcriptional regulator YafY [Tamaricihabitans halophyticus]
MRSNSDRNSFDNGSVADITARMLALLSTLQTGRSFSGAELSSRLGVSQRTLRRDIERLRGYGYPVETQPGPGGYYRLIAGRAMPPLALDDDEAVAALLGFATLAATGTATDGSIGDAAARGYGKLDQLLPARLRPRATALRTSLETGGQFAPEIDAGLFAGLAEASSDTEVITFSYRASSGETSHRRVEPHRLAQLHLRWYLLGWDVDRADWRTFRVDRIAELVRTGARHQPRTLPADSAVDYLRSGINLHRGRVELRIQAPLEQVADAFRHQDAQLSAEQGPVTRAVLWLDSWEWLTVHLAFLGADFTIVEPDWLRTACAEFADRLHRGSATSGSQLKGGSP